MADPSDPSRRVRKRAVLHPLGAGHQTVVVLLNLHQQGGLSSSCEAQRRGETLLRLVVDPPPGGSSTLRGGGGQAIWEHHPFSVRSHPSPCPAQGIPGWRMEPATSQSALPKGQNCLSLEPTAARAGGCWAAPGREEVDTARSLEDRSRKRG